MSMNMSVVDLEEIMNVHSSEKEIENPSDFKLNEKPCEEADLYPFFDVCKIIPLNQKPSKKLQKKQ